MDILANLLSPLPKNKKYLLACSAGVDSMSMLELFHNSELTFSVAHCNFKLRGENSDLDEQLVIQKCTEKEIELFSTQFETLQEKKAQESVEMLARKLRYDYFDSLMKEHQFDTLVMAHHLNDSLETFFINLSRGSGLKGLSGIKSNIEKIYRPFIHTPKKDIIAFAEKNSISWREDESNQSLEYTRNKIRHTIIPELENINSAFLKSTEKSIKIIADADLYIKKQSKKLYVDCLLSDNNDSIKLHLKALQEADFIVLHPIFNTFGFSYEEDIKNILDAKTGSKFSSGTHTIWIDRDTLIIKLSENKNSLTGKRIIINILPFESEEFNIAINYSTNETNNILDADKLELPLVIRTWEEGDFFYPYKGNGKKKISKFLKDLKVPNAEKSKIHVLCDNNNTIIAVLGLRLDDRFKATESTTKYFNINTLND